MNPHFSQNTEYLLALIRAVLDGRTAPLPPEGVDMGMLFAAADSHNLAPMLYHGLYGIGIDDSLVEPFREAHRRNMTRSVRQDMELSRIIQALDAKGLEYCLLKGIFTRELYPEPSMRVMSDIDVMVHECDRASSKAIMEELGYTCIRYGTTDDDKYKRLGLLTEFHVGLDADGLKDPAYYSDPWKLTVKTSKYGYRLSPVHEYLYTLAHAMKHFMTSGAGLRFLVDIYLYMTKASPDREETEREAEAMGITKFMRCMEKTAMAAFGGDEFDEETALIFMFMAENGAGGNSAVRETSRMIRTTGGADKGKGRYYVKRAFPTFEEMKKRDPILGKAPVLLPFMYVRRWFQLAFTQREHFNSEFEKIRAIDVDAAERLKRIHEIAGVN